MSGTAQGASAASGNLAEGETETPSGSRIIIRPVWMLRSSFTALVLAAVILAAAGLLFARVDVALLALPLFVAAAINWSRRPGSQASGTVEVTVAPRPSGQTLAYEMRVATPEGTDAVAVRLTLLGGDSREFVVTARAGERLTGSVPVLHSGPQPLVSAAVLLIGTDASLTSDPSESAAVSRVIPPPFAAITSLPLPRRLAGLTGSRDSSRPGDGGDFRDVHPFAPGDRLRRIDWKATARRARFDGDLYVRRTAATADATVIIVLDSRDEVGEQIAEWSRRTARDTGISSLDLSREAASSLAAGYIRAGDRVGVHDLSSEARLVAPGGGTRHLERVLRQVELTSPVGSPNIRFRAPIVPPGALIYVLSTFLDGGSARLASLWRGGGHRVIGVDTLPTARFERSNADERVAHRIVLMERADRLHELEAQGVEILRWHDDGAEPREARLRALSRPPRSAR
ncbi:MAG: hypothetical protein JWQ64_2586 [Subtercola sp.]|nr:hypothetical protein [Subtercola sp.]